MTTTCVACVAWLSPQRQLTNDAQDHARTLKSQLDDALARLQGAAANASAFSDFHSEQRSRLELRVSALQAELDRLVEELGVLQEAYGICSASNEELRRELDVVRRAARSRPSVVAETGRGDSDV